MSNASRKPRQGMTRRTFLLGATGGAALGLAGLELIEWSRTARFRDTPTFIAKVADYGTDISMVIRRGLAELGITEAEIRGKRILLKPNLVEVRPGAPHINTHPLVIRGAIEAFLHLGAARVMVGEGPGHCRDTLMVLDQSGVREVLGEDRIPFRDLNNDALLTLANAGGRTTLPSLVLPAALQEADWIVSLPKMKTHHWGGVTLSMKNLFGVMPGIVYGWPKNVLHMAGINASILDIVATVKPHLAIVDGIWGMEGDGPIMGTPKHAGVVVMGRNLPAVDATCARIMGINPRKVRYLHAADGWLGPIDEDLIVQRGELLSTVRTDFELKDFIAAHQGLRLA